MRFVVAVCACTLTCLGQQRERAESLKTAMEAADAGQYTQAAETLSAVLNAAGAFDPADPEFAWILNELGLIELQLGQFSAARRDLNRARGACKPDGSDDALCATVLHNLADLHIRLQEYGKAREMANRAFDIRAATARHADLARTMTMMALLELECGRYQEAERLQRNALTSLAKHMPPEIRETVVGLNNLAGILYRQKRYSAAEALLEEASTLARKSLGVEHPLTAACLWNLGTLHMNLHHYAKAEPLLAQCLELSRRSPENQHDDIAMMAMQYAKILRKLRRGREAGEYEKLAQTESAKDEGSGGHVVDIRDLAAQPPTQTRFGVISRSR